MQKDPRKPDFEHKVTKKELFINRWINPNWVREELKIWNEKRAEEQRQRIAALDAKEAKEKAEKENLAAGLADIGS